MNERIDVAQWEKFVHEGLYLRKERSPEHDEYERNSEEIFVKAK